MEAWHYVLIYVVGFFITGAWADYDELSPGDCFIMALLWPVMFPVGMLAAIVMTIEKLGISLILGSNVCFRKLSSLFKTRS